jgi:hypothetical protein
MSAAAATTIAKARLLTPISTASLPSGSPKTTIPAGIAEMFPAIDVIAITGTASPICSDRADVKKAATAQPTSSGG